jgi:hypothetical protein
MDPQAAGREPRHVMSAPAVLGFRPHTYWTAAVALAGELDAPEVIARRRIDFAEDRERFAYHQAAEMPLADAQDFLDKVGEAVTAKAEAGIGALVEELAREGFGVRAAIVPTGGARPPEQLADILRVHARIHGAEGEFYRDAVAAGCERIELEVRRATERELPGLAAARLGVEPEMLQARLQEMGASLGPPWSEDYRLATLAAWTQL